MYANTIAKDVRRSSSADVQQMLSFSCSVQCHADTFSSGRKKMANICSCARWNPSGVKMCCHLFHLPINSKLLQTRKKERESILGLTLPLSLENTMYKDTLCMSPPWGGGIFLFFFFKQDTFIYYLCKYRNKRIVLIFKSSPQYSSFNVAFYVPWHT